MGIEPTVPHKVGTYSFEDRGRHQTALFFRLILQEVTEQLFFLDPPACPKNVRSMARLNEFRITSANSSLPLYCTIF